MPRQISYGLLFSNANAKPENTYIPGSGVGARSISNRRRLKIKATDKTKACNLYCNNPK
tara:strand:+ start:9470 stop:9646 length:177 start_codon:yes stop_codon:yes gene_type:complete